MLEDSFFPWGSISQDVQVEFRRGVYCPVQLHFDLRSKYQIGEDTTKVKLTSERFQDYELNICKERVSLD